MKLAFCDTCQIPQPHAFAWDDGRRCVVCGTTYQLPDRHAWYTLPTVVIGSFRFDVWRSGDPSIEKGQTQ